MFLQSTLTPSGQRAESERFGELTLAEVDRRWPLAQPPGSVGPWGVLMLGQSLAPSGPVRRVYDAIRVQRSMSPRGRREVTYVGWHVSRDKPFSRTPESIVADLTGRPPWARVLDLTSPSGLDQVSADGKNLLPASSKRSGIEWSAEYRAALRGLSQETFQPLAGAAIITACFVDEEFSGAPHSLIEAKQWEPLLASATLAAHLEDAGVTRDELGALARMPLAAATATIAWHRWCDHVQSVVASDWSGLAPGAIVLANHYHRLPSVPAERLGVYHAARVGAGHTLGVSCVKQYGQNDGRVGQGDLTEIPWPQTAWARFLREHNRRVNPALASLSARVHLHQANFLTAPFPEGPSSGDREWPLSPLGRETLIHSLLAAGGPVWFSQRQVDPQDYPEYCQRLHRLCERTCEEIEALVGPLENCQPLREFPFQPSSTALVTWCRRRDTGKRIGRVTPSPDATSNWFLGSLGPVSAEVQLDDAGAWVIER